MDGWEVELMQRALTSTGGLVPSNDPSTLWTMDETKPTADDLATTSRWDAQLHSPVAAGAELAGTPLAVTGDFAATYGPTGRASAQRQIATGWYSAIRRTAKNASYASAGRSSHATRRSTDAASRIATGAAGGGSGWRQQRLFGVTIGC